MWFAVSEAETDFTYRDSYTLSSQERVEIVSAAQFRTSPPGLSRATSTRVLLHCAFSKRHSANRIFSGNAKNSPLSFASSRVTSGRSFGVGIS